jgi:dipeptidyl aminopeptidase/acylaminoacyl peptidase
VSLGGNDSPELMTPHDGDIAHSVYGFMPEGDKLVIGTDAFGEFRQAWTYDLNSGEQALLVDDDWDVTSVSFSPRGRYQVHSVNEDASSRVTITERASGKTIALPAGLPKGNVGGVRFTPDEKSLVLRINSDTSPGDIFLIGLGENEFSQLTTALNPKIDQADLVESSVIRYESFDGLKIPSILYKPKGANAANPVPALVLVHGGPGGQSNTGYDAEVQHLVNHGYAVLAANNRGSDGYGKTFYHLDDRRHGEDDLDDIVMARTYLESLDWVDNDKIGIWGGSYGGYMVMAALAFRPEAFEVGVNVFGVTNWIRTLLSIPDWWEAAREELYDELGDPNTDSERLHRISPLFHANNITKPVLVVQGANDPRVLQVESDEMVAAVRENNVPVEYVLFPDEGHGFNKRENRVTASEAYLSFLNKYLRGNE